jgi:cytochrome b6-f complex iron-sulfur subunit
MMSQSLNLRPSKAFCGNATGLDRSVKVQQRMAARPVTAMATAALDEVPTPEKRTIMNLLLLGAIGLPVTAMAVPYIGFFVPPKAAGGGDALPALDAEGNAVKASKWLAKHPAGDRNLVQGLKSDATYLIVTEDAQIEKYGLNAVCTHLGCVVPWNNTEKKFKCPCHGSQYNKEGKVIRGPAPLSLALAHTDIKDDGVFFSPWKETDFRTGEKPWWN